jgi:hypothetical protein
MRSSFASVLAAGVVLATLCSPASSNALGWKCRFAGGENVEFAAEPGSREGKSITERATTDILVHDGPGAVSYFEPLPTGAGTLTTIVLKTGEASRSRNTVTSLETGAFLAIQTMGTCELVQAP